jgi:hypothetical protein
MTSSRRRSQREKVSVNNAEATNLVAMLVADSAADNRATLYPDRDKVVPSSRTREVAPSSRVTTSEEAAGSAREQALASKG